MTHEQAQQYMIEALYGELDAAGAHEFEAHVSGCAGCASLYEEMRATAAAMSERRRPDPGEEYWNQYYARLEARMERETTVVDNARITARRRSYVSWGYRVAAAVAVLAAGVWLGRSTMNNGTTTPGTEVARSHTQPDRGINADSTRIVPDANVATRDVPHGPIDGPAQSAWKPQPQGNVQLASADMRARDYIDRSQVLLLELINSSPDTTHAADGDYRAQQVRAKALVREASTLRDDLPGNDNRRMRELVTELQLVLREIANLESKNDQKAVEIIRNRVDREGVLMKIDVEQMRDDTNVKKEAPKRNGAID
ncbi:MAG TPA: zf-HC2 domain-containing protein [Candidatus Krumholzibacteria bacterium]|nr:zf-HC2 domain-containing protein [Candidatus Krumholzibacteria bacterium]